MEQKMKFHKKYRRIKKWTSYIRVPHRKETVNHHIEIDNQIKENLIKDLESIFFIGVQNGVRIQINNNTYTLHRLFISQCSDGTYELEISVKYGTDSVGTTSFDEKGDIIPCHTHSLDIPISKGKIIKLKMISEECT